jgi:class 3 adenylate cyclase
MIEEKALHDCRVLIVDDTKANIDILVETLKSSYKINIATGGERALRSVHKSPPDIILLDILMPEIDGYEVCRRLKADPKTQDIPIIFISALNEVKDKTSGFNLGGADYITKPFETAEVKARVRAHLQLKLLRDQQKIYLERIEDAKSRSDQLLLNILPSSIADRLKNGEKNIADNFNNVSILFADISGFTEICAKKPATDIVVILNQIFSTFDNIAEKHGLEKIKTIGDCYMAAAGLPYPMDSHAEATALVALEMIDVVSSTPYQNLNLNFRIGINSGPVVAGVIGHKKFIYDLWGDAVNTANRMESEGLPNRVQVSASTYDLLKEKFDFEARGTIDVPGKGSMSTYWLQQKKDQTCLST